MNRNLSGTMVDLIRDGVAAADMTGPGGGDVAVFNALVRTASSASQRGWTYPEWEVYVSDAGSRLGTQARLRNGRRQRTAAAYAKTMFKAWTDAERWVEQQPPAYDRELARQAGRERANEVRNWVAEAETQLPDAERAILAHAAAEAHRLGTDRPTLPRDKMLAATGLGLTALRTALGRMHQSGLLVLEVRGRPRKPRPPATDPVAQSETGAPEKSRARANAYRLPGADVMAIHQYRGTRYVVPPAQVCGAPSVETSGAPAQVCGAPLEFSPSLKGQDMVSFSAIFTASDAETMRAGLDALRVSGVQIIEQPPTTDQAPANVVPLRSIPAERRTAS